MTSVSRNVHGEDGWGVVIGTKDSIERELGLDQEEEVAPVPRKVLDDAVGIGLGPQCETAQAQSSLEWASE